MNFSVYIIKDKKAGYQPVLYTFQNDDIAKRWFYQFYHDAVDSHPNAPIVAFPADFELYRIATFYSDNAVIDNSDNLFIACADEFQGV